MKRAIALALLALCLQMRVAIAEEDTSRDLTFFKYGLGAFNSAKPSVSSVKTLALGRQRPLGKYFVYQWELGVWTDSAGQGRTGSFFGDGMVGVHIETGPILIQSLWGVGLISGTDVMLGGHLQFMQDLVFGVRGNSGASIALVLKHISSAGISNPNRGRDLITLRVGIPW